MADIHDFYKRCLYCGGSGTEGGPATCHKCDGDGEWLFGEVHETTGGFDIYKTCHRCDGTGIFEGNTCQLCSGDGAYLWGRMEKQ